MLDEKKKVDYAYLDEDNPRIKTLGERILENFKKIAAYSPFKDKK